MERFLQAYVAPSIKFFKNDFLTKYGLVDYYDQNKPAIFFGAIESSDIINDHKGYKLIIPCTPIDYPTIKDYEKTTSVSKVGVTIVKSSDQFGNNSKVNELLSKFSNPPLSCIVL